MLYDISSPLSPRLAVWPGDTPVSRRVLLDLARGDWITLSTLTSTVHVGTHADAPNHYGHGAPSIEAVPLEPYLGPCEVRRVSVAPGTRITPEQMGGPARAPRILFATGTHPDRARWIRDFAALEPALVDRLHDEGVELVGIDTPSIDLVDSKDLPSHAACLRHGMAILEGLVLDAVPEGRYELIALPLPLEGFDGSPVRAVLRPLAG